MNGISDHVECICTRAEQPNRPPVYQMIPERCCHPEIGEYHTYGIRYSCDGHGKILHDISVDPILVERIVDLANSHDVSSIHLVDIVEDMLP